MITTLKLTLSYHAQMYGLILNSRFALRPHRASDRCIHAILLGLWHHNYLRTLETSANRKQRPRSAIIEKMVSKVLSFSTIFIFCRDDMMWSDLIGPTFSYVKNKLL